MPEGATEGLDGETDLSTEEDKTVREDGKAVSQKGDAQDPSQVGLVEKQMTAAKEQLRAGRLLAARELARKVIERKDIARFSSTWNRATRVISEVNTKLLNSNIPCPEKIRYEINPGDNLVNIARKYRTTVAALQRGNPELDKNDPTIYPGTTLLIYRGDWRIKIVKNEFVLLLMDGGKLFKKYSVAIGRQGRTPEGKFVIKNRQFHPDWTSPGRHIPYGDPDNVLGTHWLGLRPIGDTDQTLSGYGIHGTWEPDSIGTKASLGCIRMRNQDVNELYDIVRIGTEVTIRDEE
ncbi:MAG: L,D-transpeptidase family protein [Lentisphaeria bacterium]